LHFIWNLTNPYGISLCVEKYMRGNIATFRFAHVLVFIYSVRNVYYK